VNDNFSATTDTQQSTNPTRKIRNNDEPERRRRRRRRRCFIRHSFVRRPTSRRQKDRRTEGRTDGRTDGRKNRRTNWRKDARCGPGGGGGGETRVPTTPSAEVEIWREGILERKYPKEKEKRTLTKPSFFLSVFPLFFYVGFSSCCR
jgi:hypothetical protein